MKKKETRKLTKYELSEQEGIHDVLEAHKEVDEGKILKGNLDELANDNKLLIKNS